MSDTCKRCNGQVFAAENPIKVACGTYHSACFKCKECGSKLIVKTVITKNGEAWCATHVPKDSPDQGLDVKTMTALSAPAQEMGARTLGERGAGQGTQYGAGAVQIEAQLNTPKPPTSVGNVNKMESRNQGVGKFSST